MGLLRDTLQAYSEIPICFNVLGNVPYKSSLSTGMQGQGYAPKASKQPHRPISYPCSAPPASSMERLGIFSSGAKILTGGLGPKMAKG